MGTADAEIGVLSAENLELVTSRQETDSSAHLDKRSKQHHVG